jgi:chromosome partitioning protein
MIIVFGSRKGGVGKTTILCNLAVVMQKNGMKVCIVDGDPLQSATDWASARGDLDDIDPVSVIITKPGKTMLKTIRELSETYEHVLVDLAGVADENNSIIIGMADMVISPFNASNLDLNSLPALDELLQKFQEIRPNLKVHYVLNRIKHNIPAEITASLEYFSTFDLAPIRSILFDRKAWRETMGMGLGVIEGRDEKAAQEILSVFSELFPHHISENAHALS